MTTLFDKIVAGEIPCTKVYEDEKCLAFRDINPVAETHVLLIPKNRNGLDRLSCATEEHIELLGHLMVSVPRVAKACGLEDYRLVMNDGAGAGQSVFHLHLHIIGGEKCKFRWPPV